MRGHDDRGEFISISTWEDQGAIERYRESPEHHEIQKHTRALMGVSKVDVKTYEL